MCMSVFSFIPQRNEKNQLNFFNLISNHIHAKLKGNIFEMKRNLNSPDSARINLPTVMAEWLFNSELPAIFERIRNVQIQDIQTVFICLLSLPFLCVFHLWFKRYQRHVVYNDVTRDSVTFSLMLRHVTSNLYVKSSVHFFSWNIFHLLSYEQTF